MGISFTDQGFNAPLTEELAINGRLRMTEVSRMGPVRSAFARYFVHFAS